MALTLTILLYGNLILGGLFLIGCFIYGFTEEV